MINKNNQKYFLVGFFSFISSLYQIIYWFIFGLNAFEVLSSDEILYRSFSTVIYTLLLAYLIDYVLKRYFSRVLSEKRSFSSNIYKELLVLSFYIALICLVYYFKLPLCIMFFIISFGFILPSIDIDYFFDKNYLSVIDKNSVIISFLAIVSFIISTAIDDSYKILRNEQYLYSIVQQSNPNKINSYADTLKYLGKDDNNFIFISMNNDKLHFIKSDNMILYK